jgi:subtilisin family serine protease
MYGKMRFLVLGFVAAAFACGDLPAGPGDFADLRRALANPDANRPVDLPNIDIEVPDVLPAYFFDDSALIDVVAQANGRVIVGLKRANVPPLAERTAYLEGSVRRLRMPNISAEALEAARAVIARSDVREIRPFRAVRAMAMVIDPETAPQIRRLPVVDYVAPDFPLHATGFAFKSRTTVPAQSVPANIAQIRADHAWVMSTGSGVQITILDTGTDGGAVATHHDLPTPVTCLSTTAAADCATSGTDPQIAHGTGVAGVALAKDNLLDVVGVSHGATYKSVKVLPGTVFDVIEGLEYVITQPRQIVNMSLGITGVTPIFPPPPALAEAIATAHGAGHLLIAAAGNRRPQDPTWVDFPARYFDVVAVSGVKSDNSFAHPENYHLCRDPITLDFFGSRYGIEVEMSAPFRVSSLDGDDDVDTWCGTSFAAPAVAATAALIWNRSPSLTNDQVRAKLQTTALDLGSGGHDNYYGSGRVDSCDAVTCAVSFVLGGPGNLTVGQSGNFQATSIVGGVTPYTYRWYKDGALASTSGPSFSTSFSSTGTHEIKLEITPSGGVKGTRIKQVFVSGGGCTGRNC